MALVIFFVFSKLLILPRISLPAAMRGLLGSDPRATQAKDFLNAVIAAAACEAPRLTVTTTTAWPWLLRC